ncbi:MAG: hypothetical protein LAN83_05965 [Acidobacteriia bacterium]|nr:hypothetical protein [Terriglobia bacterium]
MLRSILTCLISLALLPLASAQEPAKPQVKVNVLNVCTPSPEEKQEIASALAKVPKQPLFSPDFEIARGRSTLEQSPDFLQPAGSKPASSDSATANWVRMRREFSVQALFSTVQYSFSVDSKNMVETLVLRVRDPKDLLQVSIEDSASSVTTPAAMLATNTPASRIKLERFGKSSVVLARCFATAEGPAPDQSAYEPLFQSASGIVANYRALLGAQHTVPDELARVAGTARSKPKPSAKKK